MEGHPEAAQRRLELLRDIKGLLVDSEMEILAEKLVADGGFPPEAAVDSLHVAIASAHNVDLFLTWNCRHINNAATKPLMRSICAIAGYSCPEICTPQELLSEDTDGLQR